VTELETNYFVLSKNEPVHSLLFFLTQPYQPTLASGFCWK